MPRPAQHRPQQQRPKRGQQETSTVRNIRVCMILKYSSSWCPHQLRTVDFGDNCPTTVQQFNSRCTTRNKKPLKEKQRTKTQLLLFTVSEPFIVSQCALANSGQGPVKVENQTSNQSLFTIDRTSSPNGPTQIGPPMPLDDGFHSHSKTQSSL